MDKIKLIIDKIKNSERTAIPKDVEWKEFRLNEIFLPPMIGKELIKSSLEGNNNLVSSCEGNNGVVRKIKDGKKLFTANKLTLSKNGSVGTVYYQNNSFYATSDVIILQNEHLNENIGLFLKVSMEKFTKKFNWGDKINLSKYSSLTIYLPSKNNQPNWEYMDKFIENLKATMKINSSPSINFSIKSIVNRIKNNRKTKILRDMKWKEFRLNEIFEIKNAKNINSTKLTYSGNNNDIPHISRQIENNAIKGYVSDYPKENLNNGKCLCIDMFLNTTWQEKDFLAVDHVLVARNKNLNQNNALFCKVLIEKLKYKFSYSNIFCKERSNLIVFLPSKNNQPDWEYMDKFIENLKATMKINSI